MQEIWRENGPPAYMSLASYIGWKPPKASDKNSTGAASPHASDDGDEPPPGYAPLSELAEMFGDTGGIIQ